MISLKELHPTGEKQSAEIESNLAVLLKKINVIRSAYGKPMTVTSGLRTMAKHLAIYEKTNADRKAKGLAPVKVPLGSRHLYGQAVDIADASGSLWNWCMSNMKVLENAGLYLEDRSATPTWIHFQIVAPASGKRIFIP